MRLLLVVLCLAVCMAPAVAANLVVDPGFEALPFWYIAESTDPGLYWMWDALSGAMDYTSWITQCVPSGGLYSGAASEQVCATYWANDVPSTIHGGAQALRMYEYSPTQTLSMPPIVLSPAAQQSVWQFIAVGGNTTYSASAWVRTVATTNYAAYGGVGLFGNSGLDRAGIRIIEFNAANEVVGVTHSSYLADATNTWRQVATSFTTSTDTTYVQFALDSTLSIEKLGGYAVFDDCSLEAVPEPGSMVALATGLAGLVGLVRRRR